MSRDEIHIGDVGTVVRATIYDGSSVLDISAADTSTSRSIVFRKPDGTTSTQAASFVTTGSDGAIQYTVNTSTFWDVDGTWKLQAIVQLGTTTSRYHSDVHSFRVHLNLL